MIIKLTRTILLFFVPNVGGERSLGVYDGVNGDPTQGRETKRCFEKYPSPHPMQERQLHTSTTRGRFHLRPKYSKINDLISLKRSELKKISPYRMPPSSHFKTQRNQQKYGQFNLHYYGLKLDVFQKSGLEQMTPYLEHGSMNPIMTNSFTQAFYALT
ncbi:hypothetical protein NPIL_66701 [Nephila pilipes]|uniref:Uncharacterized protein n=1 Tax=Nephila pilipes TaxID=299642 RepID=A0A8X6Q124_NEPPI|nr:hypothetical protein NPIL_404331 [Nephila pilipes]GFU31242.1 hypothetical protein NPIL_66701 [Nephila pilipes]